MRSIAKSERTTVAADRPPIFVAVVHSADGVRLAVAAESRPELVRRLADYVRRRAAHVLRAEHARYLRALLTRGELEAAVEVYFGFVGERWDEEWLVTTALASEDAGGMTALVGSVAPLADGERTRSRRVS